MWNIDREKIIALIELRIPKTERQTEITTIISDYVNQCIKNKVYGSYPEIAKLTRLTLPHHQSSGLGLLHLIYLDLLNDQYLRTSVVVNANGKTGRGFIYNASELDLISKWSSKSEFWMTNLNGFGYQKLPKGTPIVI